MTDNDRLTVEPKKVVRQASKRPDTLEQAVVRQLDQYFAQLGGSQPHPLYNLVVTAVERPLLIYALRMCNWNQCKAAELLGINRNTLRKKLVSHGLMQ